jgi:CDP-paratose 2-epimerase
MKKLLVTGSSGLIGSEVCIHFAQLGSEIHGVDNNQRANLSSLENAIIHVLT